MFHFLLDASDRKKYVTVLKQSLIPGGHVIIGTFASDAPPTCSGLPVCRYDRAALERASRLPQVQELDDAHANLDRSRIAPQPGPEDLQRTLLGGPDEVREDLAADR